MRKILFIISLFLTFTLNAQIRSGVIASQRIITPISNYISNGTFDDATGWNISASYVTISGEKVNYDNLGAGYVRQASASMVAPLVGNTAYTLTFDLTISSGTANIAFNSYSGTDVYAAQASYSTGANSINFTTPVSPENGLRIYFYNTSTTSFTIDNVVITLQ